MAKVNIPKLNNLIYNAPPRPLDPPIQRPNSDRLLGNLGARVVLAAPTSLFSLDNSRGAIGPVERLISAGPELLENTAPGSWIVNLNASYIFPNGAPVAGTYGSVTARVWFGSGGTQQYVDVDAWNSKVVIPGTRVSVDVFWECLGLSPTFGPINVFPVEVTVTLQRSNVSNSAMPPIKSYWVLEMDGAGSLTLPVPPFATAYNFLPMSYTAVGTPPLTVLGTTVGGQDLVDPLVIESMSRMNQFRALSPSAKVLSMTGAFPFQFPGRIQYQINS